jgi:hypothetical protein
MSFFMNNNFTYIVILKPFYKKIRIMWARPQHKEVPTPTLHLHLKLSNTYKAHSSKCFFLRVAHTNSLHKDIHIFYVDGVMVILCPHFSIASTTTNDNVNLSIYGPTPIHTLRSCNCTRREVSWHDWSL